MPILEEICKWGVHNVPDSQTLNELL
ncbi:hypothetical protein PTQ21_04580 [Paenibacillus marchantiae]|nr:hypothetical protein [Paenibacillus marchantiae]WDQ35683.1 hypothetical protein PTQ21_04580 [Paenibacillus marchantiae]